jgi:Caspase domain
MFGLFIGIDEYESQEMPKLRGCKSDAESFMGVLLHRFHVPPDNFLFLADKRATRSAIIDGFQNHLINNGDIQRGDAIVIFYAGHGSQTNAPNGWVADGSKVEMICPHDERSIGNDGKRIFGIPDRTIGGLLRSLASTKGDNVVRVTLCSALSSS